MQVVSLPKGTDPADDPKAFEAHLARPVSYPVHRVRLLHERARDKNASFAAVRTFLASLPDSPERQDALRLATDLLDLPPEMQAGLAPARGSARSTGVVSPRLLDAGSRLERAARLRAWRRIHRSPSSSPSSVPSISTTRCTAAPAPTSSVNEGADGELTPLLAELYALADEDDITEQTAEQLLLRLRERKLQRELAAPSEADEGRLATCSRRS